MGDLLFLWRDSRFSYYHTSYLERIEADPTIGTKKERHQIRLILHWRENGGINLADYYHGD
jgi:hypothetical protein